MDAGEEQKMLPRVILHNVVSLDGRLDVSLADVGLYYQLGHSSSVRLKYLNLFYLALTMFLRVRYGIIHRAVLNENSTRVLFRTE